jgi:two-component system, NtrC family, sensor histidine kinase PilS
LNRRDRVHSETLNLSEKLSVFIETLQYTEGVEQGVIKIDVAPACEVQFDRGHFDQVLWNLCRNALRYCLKKPGSVHLRAWQAEDGTTVLEVLNDGPPVDADAAQKLFEPFFTTSAGGTGLGLYIARELCAANGALLEYRPQMDGRVCFRMVFGGKRES